MTGLQLQVQILKLPLFINPRGVCTDRLDLFCERENLLDGISQRALQAGLLRETPGDSSCQLQQQGGAQGRKPSGHFPSPCIASACTWQAHKKKPGRQKVVTLGSPAVFIRNEDPKLSALPSREVWLCGNLLNKKKTNVGK